MSMRGVSAAAVMVAVVMVYIDLQHKLLESEHQKASVEAQLRCFSACRGSTHLHRLVHAAPSIEVVGVCPLVQAADGRCKIIVPAAKDYCWAGPNKYDA